jgi:hypothetical protein
MNSTYQVAPMIAAISVETRSVSQERVSGRSAATVVVGARSSVLIMRTSRSAAHPLSR